MSSWKREAGGGVKRCGRCGVEIREGVPCARSAEFFRRVNGRRRTTKDTKVTKGIR